MTESSTEHPGTAPDVRPTEQFAPGEPFPDPTAPTAPHAWAEPVRDRALSDAASPWSAADGPGEVPPTLAGIDVARRVGWLTAGRDTGSDGAA